MAVSPKLHVGAFADLIILRPNSAIAHDDSGITMPQDSLLQGSLRYDIPTAQTLKSLRVELVGQTELLFADRAERYETLSVGVDLDVSHNKSLVAGLHEMVFTLRIPATTAPHERNMHGNTEHVLRAIAVKEGWLSKTVIAEQCITAGMFTHKEVVNHNPDPEGLPLPFTMSTEQLDPDLGPVKIQLTSRFLLIAGFLQISVLIPSVTRKVRLDDITVSLIERVKLESYKRPGIKEIKPDRTTRLCSLIEDRRSEPISLEPGAGFSTREQFRIPIFARLSASTADRSGTGLRVSHKMCVRLIYTVLEDNPNLKPSVLANHADCIVTACACVIDALQLPSYAEALSATLPPLRDIGFCSECLCHIADTARLRQMYGVPDEDMTKALEWRSLTSTSVDADDQGWKSRRSRAPY